MIWQDKNYCPKWLIVFTSHWKRSYFDLIYIRFYWGDNYGFTLRLINFHFSIHYFPKGRDDEW
jgi:hypothetical protein